MEHEQFMRRCLELASLGQYHTAPNPMVGAVLVYQNTIIGEGYHQRYGGKHAEINCFESVKESDRSKIKESTLYVSLEPCVHYGKTPPCADAIIQYQVPKVVVASLDCHEIVCGKGIAKLRAAGIEVITGVLDEEQKVLNKRFYTFFEKKRPYVVLKWAESADGFIGSPQQRIMITTSIQDRAVHKLRAQQQAILVGKNTAALDNPKLDTRKWMAKDLVRVVLDSHLSLDSSLHFFRKEGIAIVLNTIKDAEQQNIEFVRLEEMTVPNILDALYHRNIISIMVEGGAETLKSFIEHGIHDEIHIFKGDVIIGQGIKAPAADALKIYVG